MRQLIGAMCAAVLALPAFAAPDPSAAATRADLQAGTPAPPAFVPAPTPHAAKGPTVVEHYVDLNTASRKELMTLPGIGAAEASRIIANRPYLTKTQLVTKNALPVGPFLSIRRLVVALPTSVSKGRP
jgi:DNA uptake protein ComE-like DNA-binding protein